MRRNGAIRVGLIFDRDFICGCDVRSRSNLRPLRGRRALFGFVSGGALRDHRLISRTPPGSKPCISAPFRETICTRSWVVLHVPPGLITSFCHPRSGAIWSIQICRRTRYEPPRPNKYAGILTTVIPIQRGPGTRFATTSGKIADKPMAAKTQLPAIKTAAENAIAPTVPESVPIAQRIRRANSPNVKAISAAIMRIAKSM